MRIFTSIASRARLLLAPSSNSPQKRRRARSLRVTGWHKRLAFSRFHHTPYSTVAILNLLNRLAHRAGIGHVHPHSLRRACACHMLTSGADIRSIQVLLGHKNIRNTQIYTTLTADELKKIHEKYHPHEQGRKPDGEKEEG